MIDHLTFFIVLTIPLAVLFLYDKKNIKTYLGLGLLAMALDSVWDPLAMSFGLWHYSSQPQILGMSVYMLLLYLHYLSFCFFLGNRVNDRVVKKWR
jgi:hypothetical protein